MPVAGSVDRRTSTNRPPESSERPPCRRTSGGEARRRRRRCRQAAPATRAGVRSSLIPRIRALVLYEPRGDEHRRRHSMPLEQRQRLRQVVHVSVVERDRDGSRGHRTVPRGGDHRLQRHRPKRSVRSCNCWSNRSGSTCRYHGFAAVPDRWYMRIAPRSCPRRRLSSALHSPDAYGNVVARVVRIQLVELQFVGMQLRRERRSRRGHCPAPPPPIPRGEAGLQTAVAQMVPVSRQKKSSWSTVACEMPGNVARTTPAFSERPMKIPDRCFRVGKLLEGLCEHDAIKAIGRQRARLIQVGDQGRGGVFVGVVEDVDRIQPCRRRNAPHRNRPEPRGRAHGCPRRGGHRKSST